MDALMNVIEESKEQVPDMVYKNLIESFAKARIEKQPIGFWVKLKVLKTELWKDHRTQGDCDCDYEIHEEEDCKNCYIPRLFQQGTWINVYFDDEDEEFTEYYKTQDETDCKIVLEKYLKKNRGYGFRYNSEKNNLVGFGKCWSPYALESDRRVYYANKGKIEEFQIRFCEYFLLDIEHISPIYE